MMHKTKTIPFPVYREMEIIELTMLPDKFEPVLSAMIQSAKDDENNEAYFYSHVLPKALTYTGNRLSSFFVSHSVHHFFEQRSIAYNITAAAPQRITNHHKKIRKGL
jgi:hypothetical protein